MSEFSFGQAQARQLIDTMRVIHGGLFVNQMGNVSPAQIETIIIGALFCITEQQFNFGLAQISSSRFCPTIADFKAMCIAGSWWSVDEAWARACEYTKDRTKKITTLAKFALDQVEYMINLGQMSEARNQFKGVYATNLLKAQATGTHQQWYQAPKQIACKIADMPAAQQCELSDEDKRIQLMTAQLMKQGLKFKDAFNQSQMAIRGEILEVNKMTPDIKKLEVKPDTDYWPDPFDENERYVEQLTDDGQSVPTALRWKA